MHQVRTAITPFGFLWAFALLYHQVAYRAVLASPLDAALTVAAVVTLWVPGSHRSLGVLAALHVATVWQHLPQAFNHWYFAGLVSLALLFACSGAWLRERRSATPTSILATAFAPAGRASLLLLYALSGLHKLNRDFLDPGVSCATVLGRNLGLPAALSESGTLFIWLTLAVELGLPILLVLRPCRRVGVVIGIGFHLGMAAAGYSRFSALGVALLTLFLAPEALTWQAIPGARLSALAARVGDRVSRGAACAAGLAALLLAAALRPELGDRAFFATGVLLAVIVLLAAAQPAREPGSALDAPLPRAWRIALPALAVPALLLLSGMTPYLGLGTERALSMYSNLRTEGGRSNHLLLPATTQLFPFQRELVAVLGSSAERLQRLADRNLLIPYEELRAQLSEEVQRAGPDVSLRYRYREEVHAVVAAGRDSALHLPASYWGIRLLRFRAIEASGPRRCGP